MRFALFRRREPDPDHIEVVHEGTRYRVALKRRAGARRMTLRLSSATGDLTLTLPDTADLAAARRFAAGQGGWIAARVARLPERIAFAPGAEIPLRGEPHRIVHWTTLRRPVRPERDAQGHPVLTVGGEAEFVAKRVREFLEAEARRDLTEAVARYAAALGRRPRRLTLRDTRSRWGSCSATGGLNFSWRLILAPPRVLDYLAAHEVAHLQEMNHSDRFWRVVHRLCPHTEEAEAWLKRHGSSLHRYG